FPFDHVKIQVNYVQGFSGENLFIIKSTDAAVISDIMLGGDGRNPDHELNEIHLSAVQEAMNQMMGAAATSMSTIFNKMVNISPPTTQFGKAMESKDDDQSSVNLSDETLVKVSFQLKVGELIDSNIMQLIPFPFAHELVEELLHGQQEETELETITPKQAQNVVDTENVEEQQATDAQTIQTTTNQQVEGNQYLGGHENPRHEEEKQETFSELKQLDLTKSKKRN